MKILKVLLVTVLLLLCACTKEEKIEILSDYDNLDAYTKYLELVEGEDTFLDFYYYEGDNGLALYLDNFNNTFFARAYLNLYENNEDEEPYYKSDAYYLVRPYDYLYIGEIENRDDIGYYNLYGYENYKLNYEENLKYDFYYDEDDYGYYTGILIDNVDDDIALRILKKEYVISVLTELYMYDILIFEDDDKYDLIDNYPNVNDYLYYGVLDFDNKTIELYKGTDLINSIEME